MNVFFYNLEYNGGFLTFAIFPWGIKNILGGCEAYDSYAGPVAGRWLRVMTITISLFSPAL